MSLSMQTVKTNDSRAMLAAHDQDEMRDTMADVLGNIGELELVLSTQPPEEAEMVMRVIQEVCTFQYRCGFC
jgi:hypothetical protein